MYLCIMKHQQSDYFNVHDLFLVDNTLGKYYVTQCHLYNGAWYSNEGLALKMTSVLSVNCAELYHKEVAYKGTNLRGKLCKFLSPRSIGVLWDQGQSQEFKKSGMPQYWNEFENLEML